jgi:hypothetical protein
VTISAIGQQQEAHYRYKFRNWFLGGNVGIAGKLFTVIGMDYVFAVDSPVHQKTPLFV